MRKKILEKLFQFILKRPLIVLISSLILGGLFFAAFIFIPLKSDYIDLLPPKSEPVVALKDLSQILKGVGQFSIVVQSSSEDIEGMSRFAEKLNSRLETVIDIEYINFKIPQELKKNAFLFIDVKDLKTIYERLQEKVYYEMFKDAPIFINLEDENAVDFNIDDIIEKYQGKGGGLQAYQSEYLISSDKKILVIFIKPDFMPTNVDRTGELIDIIEGFVKEIGPQNYGKDLTVSYAGTYVLSHDQKNAIYNDIKVTSIIAFILIFLAILFFIRNFKNSLFLLYALTIGVLSAFAYAFVILHHINLITGFLIAILTGLGVNYGIHFLFRYNEEIAHGHRENALKDSFIKTGLASLTGALTTAVSFFTLTFSKFLGFSEFGILASLGIMTTLVSTYIVVAGLMMLFSKKKQSADAGEVVSLEERSRFSEKEQKQSRFIIFLVSIMLLLFSTAGAYFLKNIRFEYNSKKLEVKGQQSIETSEMIQEKFNISTEPAIFYTSKRDEEIDFYQTINKMMKDDKSQIGSIMTLSRILNSEDVQKKKIELIKKIKKEFQSLPENSIKDPAKKKQIDTFFELTKDLHVLTENDIPSTLKRRFIAYDKGKEIYISQIFPDKILFDAREMKAFVKEIKEIKGQITTYRPTGMYILYVFLIDTVFRESKIFISIVFFVIWILLLIDFKNLKDSLIAMIPLIFGLLWLFEIMSLFHVKFNFMNIVVLPTVLGTGVDNGVHIYHRYKETGSIFDALKRTGFANFGMSLTVALGWSALFFAHYQGLRTMAFVGVVGILLTFVASVTIMPAMILILDQKSKK